MRRSLTVTLFVLFVSAAALPASAQNPPSVPAGGRSQPWRPDAATLARAESDVRPLPRPTFTEPFAIGEALHDPSRVEQAVVSLLALMHIEIVPASADGTLTLDPTHRKLTEPEVRALIAMGISDAEAQAQDPSGPFTFRTLHARLASSLTGVSPERLAEIYATEYEAHPERLAAQVLLGQPIEPDMPLLRTELWLLLLDAVLPANPGRAAARTGPRVVLARTMVAQAPAAATMLGTNFHSPNAPNWSDGDWADLLVRLPFIMAMSIKLTPGLIAHEGHAGPGQTVTIDARVNAPRIIAGRAQLVPQQNRLTGPVTWSTDATIRKHAPGAPQTRTDTVGATGTARLSLTARPEPAKGRGLTMAVPGLVELSLDLDSLVSDVYNVSTRGAVLGKNRIGLGEITVKTTVLMEWHAADTLDIVIGNSYTVGARIIGLTRTGTDGARGVLALEADGTYRGVAMLTMDSVMTLPGKACSPHLYAWQYADVVAVPIAETAQSLPVPTPPAGPGQGAPTPSTQLPAGAQTSIGFYTAVHTRQGYNFNSGTPARYFRLEFTPTTNPVYMAKGVVQGGGLAQAANDDCHEEIPSDPTVNQQAGFVPRTPNFIPLNDAQWTIRGYGSVGGADTVNVAGYAIAAPLATRSNQPATLDYVETRTQENGAALSKVGLASFVKSESKWEVTVTHTKAPD